MSDAMYQKAYFDVQKVLDDALGTEEQDGAGGGIAGDVWLLAQQRDAARDAWRGAEAERSRLADLAEKRLAAREDWKARCIAAQAEVERERSSRQAWAEHAAALKQAALDCAEELRLLVQMMGKPDPDDSARIGRRTAYTKAEAIVHGYFGAVMDDWPLSDATRPCACPTDEQLSKLSPVFTRPVCAVHPDGGGDR